MENSIFIGLLVVVLLALLLVRAKQGKKKARPSSQKHSENTHKAETAKDEDLDWMTQVDQSVSDGIQQNWAWNDADADSASASVSAQEVDPLTEYQVYRQFGYQSKAADSLAAYLYGIPEGQHIPENLICELLELNLETGDTDALAEHLQKYGALAARSKIEEYVQQALQENPHHLGIRVFAEEQLGWDIQEIEKRSDIRNQTAENVQTASEGKGQERATSAKRVPIVKGGKFEVSQISPEEIGAITGLVRADQGAKILKDKVAYETVLKQYNRAIQTSEKPANLIIDALKLDYQHDDINQFAGHLWRLYHTLGGYGRQVKERMLGWGYSLGYHEVFDDLEKGPSEQQIKEIGVERGYLHSNTNKTKAKYKDLVLQDNSLISTHTSPADDAIKEVESLLMYGQLDAAMEVLEQAVLKYPAESQLYITLIDIYERTEDWERLEQFLKVLRERVERLPEEVVMIMSRLLQKMNQSIKK